MRKEQNPPPLYVSDETKGTVGVEGFLRNVRVGRVKRTRDLERLSRDTVEAGIREASPTAMQAWVGWWEFLLTLGILGMRLSGYYILQHGIFTFQLVCSFSSLGLWFNYVHLCHALKLSLLFLHLKTLLPCSLPPSLPSCFPPSLAPFSFSFSFFLQAEYVLAYAHVCDYASSGLTVDLDGNPVLLNLSPH